MAPRGVVAGREPPIAARYGERASACLRARQRLLGEPRDAPSLSCAMSRLETVPELRSLLWTCAFAQMVESQRPAGFRRSHDAGRAWRLARRSESARDDARLAASLRAALPALRS